MNCPSHGKWLDALGSCEDCAIWSVCMARTIERERGNVDWFKEAPRYKRMREMKGMRKIAVIVDGEVTLRPMSELAARIMQKAMTKYDWAMHEKREVKRLQALGEVEQISTYRSNHPIAASVAATAAPATESHNGGAGTGVSA